MKKYQKGLVQDIKENQQKEIQQTQLKKKYDISDENVVVVEKSNVYKFTVKMLIRFIKTIFSIIILILAMIGLASLIYPGPRAAMIQLFYELYQELQTLLF